MRKAQQNHCFHSTEVTGKNNGSDFHINEKAHNNDLVSHNNNLLISNVCMHIIMHHVSHYYDLQSQKINWSEYGSPFIIVKDSTFRQSNQTRLKKNCHGNHSGFSGFTFKLSNFSIMSKIYIHRNISYFIQGGSTLSVGTSMLGYKEMKKQTKWLMKHLIWIMIT